MTFPTASPNQAFTCPQCGGAMNFQQIGSDRRAKCPYCQTVVDLPDVEPAAPLRVEYVARPVSAPKDDKLAKTSLVAAIIGLIGCFPIIGSLVAIWAGRQALRQIAKEPDLYSGGNLARLGVTLGWFGLGMTALLFCFGVGMNLLNAVMTILEQAR